MAFAPLVLAGIADDLARGLRVASYGGPYNKATPADALRVFLDQFQYWRLDVPLAVTFLLAAWPKNGWSRMARTWCLAWLGALVYRPLHPVHHVYLIHPVLLVASITWAFPVSLLLSARRVARPVLVLGVVILAYEALPVSPYTCSLPDSFYAFRTLALGKMPARPPWGCSKPFSRSEILELQNPAWGNYCALLGYLRRTTSPRTMIANVLNRYPFEALNGPTGRLSPFMAESGICWMTWVDIDLDPEFAEALQRADDSVAVCRTEPPTSRGCGTKRSMRLSVSIMSQQRGSARSRSGGASPSFVVPSLDLTQPLARRMMAFAFICLLGWTRARAV